MYNNAKILITGASGFIGIHLLNKLLSYESNIACIDLNNTDKFREKYCNKVKIYSGNLLDKNFAQKVVHEFRPEFIFHFAGSKCRTNKLQEFTDSIDVNYFGSLNLFEALINLDCLKKIIVLGTIEEYGSAISPFSESSIEFPNSAYGLSKLTTTKLALIFHQQFNLPVVIFRPSLAYGPGQKDDMFISAIIRTLIKGEVFEMTAGEQMRDFIYIDDLIEALITQFMHNDKLGVVINIANGTSVKLKHVAERIAEILNQKQILKIGVFPYRKYEIMNYSVDVCLAKKLFDWHSKTSLEDGLIQTINYFKEIYTNEK